jgi:hypothetical protein
MRHSRTNKQFARLKRRRDFHRPCRRFPTASSLSRSLLNFIEDRVPPLYLFLTRLKCLQQRRINLLVGGDINSGIRLFRHRGVLKRRDKTFQIIEIGLRPSPQNSGEILHDFRENTNHID